MIQRFKKKPTPIEAIRFDGTNGNEIMAWAGDGAIKQYTVEAIERPTYTYLLIMGSGNKQVSTGYWVTKDANGNFDTYPNDIFPPEDYEPE